MSATRTADVAVVGAGIAGASVAAELASSDVSVVLLEREPQPGYHTTGRSAAQFSEIYGPEVIRALSRASRAALESPPEGVTTSALLSPRGTLFVAVEGQEDALAGLAAEFGAAAETLSAEETHAVHSGLDRDRVVGGLHEPGAKDIDVDALHQGYLRALRAAGGRVVQDAEALSLARADGVWRMETRAGGVEAPIVVDAAGAWADEVGALAGCRPIGLVPKRRTAILFDPTPRPGAPGFEGMERWPLVVDAEETVYFKPDAGRLLGSPADQTPSPPTDAQPEDVDVAIAVDRLERLGAFTIPRIAHAWAGLRSFVADKGPVAGFDGEIDGFFWLAGQGGYGIQTAPALARCAAALVLGRDLPEDVRAEGVGTAALDPNRPALADVRSGARVADLSPPEED